MYNVCDANLLHGKAVYYETRVYLYVQLIHQMLDGEWGIDNKNNNSNDTVQLGFEALITRFIHAFCSVLIHHVIAV